MKKFNPFAILSVTLPLIVALAVSVLSNAWLTFDWPYSAYVVHLAETPEGNFACDSYTATYTGWRLLVGNAREDSGHYKGCVLRMLGTEETDTLQIHRRPFNPFSLKMWAAANSPVAIPKALLDGYCSLAEYEAQKKQPEAGSPHCKRFLAVTSELTAPKAKASAPSLSTAQSAKDFAAAVGRGLAPQHP